MVEEKETPTKTNSLDKAIEIVRRLEEKRETEKRTYPPDIEAVFVFSGPGTYFQRLKPEDEEWMGWMDKDRIRLGVALVREVTASRMREADLAQDKRGHFVSKEDIIKNGPVFIYNGTQDENRDFRKALSSQFAKIPKEKVDIIDTFVNSDGNPQPYRHTGDQVKGLYQHLVDPKSRLYGVRNIALVSHLAHFMRIPFYIEKYHKEYLSEDVVINYYPYALEERGGNTEINIDEEIPKITEYIKRGDMSDQPYPLII